MKRPIALLDNYWILGAVLPDLDKRERSEVVKLLRDYEVDDLQLTGVQGQFLTILQVYKRLIGNIKKTLANRNALDKFNANNNELQRFRKLMQEQIKKDKEGISRNKITRITITFKDSFKKRGKVYVIEKNEPFESEIILSYFINSMDAFHSQFSRTNGYHKTKKYSKGPEVKSSIIGNPYHILPLCYFLEDNFRLNKKQISNFISSFLRIAGATWPKNKDESYAKKIYDIYTQAASTLAKELGLDKKRVDTRQHYLP